METNVYTISSRASAQLQARHQERYEKFPEPSELTVGHVLQAALQNGLRIQSVQFPERDYLDIGTPDNLVKAVHGKKFTNDDRR